LTLPTFSLRQKILSQEEFDARFARHLIEGLTMGMVEGGALILLTSAPYPKKELG